MPSPLKQGRFSIPQSGGEKKYLEYIFPKRYRVFNVSKTFWKGLTQLPKRLFDAFRQIRVCFLIMSIMSGFIILSCFLGVYFTTRKEYGYSMGDAFTLAGYVVAVGTLICGFMYASHFPACQCWKRKTMTPECDRPVALD